MAKVAHGNTITEPLLTSKGGIAATSNQRYPPPIINNNHTDTQYIIHAIAVCKGVLISSHLYWLTSYLLLGSHAPH